jgi:Domain of unknown function (DUF4352)
MTKLWIYLSVLLIGIILICGCTGNSSVPTTSTTVAKSPIPTAIPIPKSQFNIMEPVSDSNLNVTVLSSADGERVDNDKKKFFVKVRLENVRKDTTIHVTSTDFSLLSSYPGKIHTSSIENKPGYDLGPGQYGEPDLEFTIPQDAKDLQLQFDFSGPAGLDQGGQVVYFKL